MQIRFRLLIIAVLILTPGFTVQASDYPKNQVEREMDEMGSVLGADGLLFRPRKIKADTTQISSHSINKYLFDAAINVLKFTPLASADSNSGTVITEWYNTESVENTEFKIIVYIKDSHISVEGLEVIAFERTKQKNGWSSSRKSTIVANTIADKIIRKARDLYLQSVR